jgi:hypothetical protein
MAEAAARLNADLRQDRFQSATPFNCCQPLAIKRLYSKSYKQMNKYDLWI